KGNLLFDDKANAVRVKSQEVSSVVVSAGGQAVIKGTAAVNDEPGHAFTVTVVDSGEPGTEADRIEVILDTGYTAAGTLTSGNVQVHDHEGSCWQAGSEPSAEILSQWSLLFGPEGILFLME